MEVWVTNKNGATTDAREIVGLMDLGESNPYHPFTVTGTLPSNNTNSEYRDITSNPNSRNAALITNQLQNMMGLSPVQDFEKTFARKLDSTQYIFNSESGLLIIEPAIAAR